MHDLKTFFSDLGILKENISINTLIIFKISSNAKHIKKTPLNSSY